MIGGCMTCRKITAALFLLLGAALLLVDLKMWSFLGISWWSGAFIVIGVTGLAKTQCKACQAMMKK